MSREFKFRVWSVDQKTYDYKFPYNSIGDFYVSSRGKVFSDFGNTIVPEVRQEAFIVEQSTGLKDKNGKEIYEGDIVELDWYIYGDKPAYRVKSKVIFDEEGARVCNGKHSDLLKYCTGIEVIGNIHENPELWRPYYGPR